MNYIKSQALYAKRNKGKVNKGNGIVKGMSEMKDIQFCIKDLIKMGIGRRIGGMKTV